MRDISYILALIGVLVLLASMAAWKKVVGEPELELALGHVGSHSRGVRYAAVATLVAFGLSGAAAVIAILGWLTRG